MHSGNEESDFVFVGAGIMSATLAVMLKELEPTSTVEVLELLDVGAAESSNPWNNAGTGHAALCELNYTPEKADGSIDVTKALSINGMFEASRQFWSYLVEEGHFGSPRAFISPVPHMSFVHGAKDMAFLRKRYEALKDHACFDGMEYSEDHAKLREWMPLVMEGRPATEAVAATHVAGGTDVNFGALTMSLLGHLQTRPGTQVRYNQKVVDLTREADQRWRLTIEDSRSGATRTLIAKFVFLGAGGAALPLLQKSGIPEGAGYGGFPVSGQWLRCDDPHIVERHQAKVYGLAGVNSPPMSVPHLDTRVVDGKKSLLFGPFAGFTTKFLKRGSFLDLPKSIKSGNIGPMLAVARDNMPLTRYLVGQVLQSFDQRVEELRAFYPAVRKQDWRLEVAGQRVQIIKKDPQKGGILQFGTEIVASGDGTIAALLGASPGASTSVSIMLTLVERCFPSRYQSEEWQAKLRKMFPSFGHKLAEEPELLREVRERTTRVLQLDQPA
ncbi:MULTISPECIES: malate dehydrogenase (quinone) [Pseudomonas]|uniref:malate dehydrogenase (quinone) n=1 Tax=Pseudomonas TaxID=286 RepID=UPI0002E5E58E|nr:MULTISPECIES: malate dehydrogenase (quinone) [Pseudomonas]MDC7827739.1 malate dehydrogenase (quinone) [Pseudomonas benzopyrenica]NRH41240.1 malate dehydrogenase (quinone) [Pseudomonas sp. MS15a(2019)]